MHGYYMTIIKICIKVYRPISSVVRAPHFTDRVLKVERLIVEVVGSNPTWANTIFYILPIFVAFQ